MAVPETIVMNGFVYRQLVPPPPPPPEAAAKLTRVGELQLVKEQLQRTFFEFSK